jgi:hypothetical protein
MYWQTAIVKLILPLRGVEVVVEVVEVVVNMTDILLLEECTFPIFLGNR